MNMHVDTGVPRLVLTRFIHMHDAPYTMYVCSQLQLPAPSDGARTCMMWQGQSRLPASAHVLAIAVCATQVLSAHSISPGTMPASLHAPNARYVRAASVPLCAFASLLHNCILDGRLCTRAVCFDNASINQSSLSPSNNLMVHAWVHEHRESQIQNLNPYLPP